MIFIHLHITVMETNKTCGLAYFGNAMDVDSSLIDGLHDKYIETTSCMSKGYYYCSFHF